MDLHAKWCGQHKWQGIFIGQCGFSYSATYKPALISFGANEQLIQPKNYCFATTPQQPS
jgi:hypothetical protein